MISVPARNTDRSSPTLGIYRCSPDVSKAGSSCGFVTGTISPRGRAFDTIRLMSMPSPMPSDPRQRRLPARMRRWSVVQWIILINVVLYVADELGRRRLMAFGAFSMHEVRSFQVWRMVFSLFLHWDRMHILVNMLFLWYFGPPMEARLGRLKFIVFYFLCGLSGELSYIVLARLHVLDVTVYTRLAGASAAVLGVMVGLAWLEPHRRVNLLLIPTAIPIRVMVAVFLGLALLTILSFGTNAGGEAAHLGGFFAGYLLARFPRVLGAFDPPKKPSRFWRPGDPSRPFLRDDFKP